MYRYEVHLLYFIDREAHQELNSILKGSPKLFGFAPSALVDIKFPQGLMVSKKPMYSLQASHLT